MTTPLTVRRGSAWLRSSLLLLLLGLPGCLQTMTPVRPDLLPVTSHEAQQLSSHVHSLASPTLEGRQPGTTGNLLAAAYIEQQFQAVGVKVFPSLGSYRQPIGPEIGDNVVGMLPASDASPNGRWIVLGAHFDHLGKGFLGADDNASALAILIETARRIAALTHISVAVLAFNSEEPPYFNTPRMGSEWFVQHLPPEIGDTTRIQAAIIMDLMGGVQWEPLKDTVFAIGAEKSPTLYRRLKESLPRNLALRVFPVGIHLVEEIPGRGHESFSDYHVFRNRQVPFLFLSTARTPRYHTTEDRADTLHSQPHPPTHHTHNPHHPANRFDPNGLEFADEIATFRSILTDATNPRSLIPGTSRWSLWKLNEEREWLHSPDALTPSSENQERLERISVRFQCLFADYSGCFTF
ncbi:MAG: M28 family peptidase [Nitrospiraceae bacterium]